MIKTKMFGANRGKSKLNLILVKIKQLLDNIDSRSLAKMQKSF